MPRKQRLPDDVDRMVTHRADGRATLPKGGASATSACGDATAMNPGFP